MSQENKTETAPPAPVIETLAIRATFTTPLLGTAINDLELHEKYIAAKAVMAKPARAPEAELDDLSPQEELEKMTSVFSRENGEPFLYDYQVKGYFKEALKHLAEIGAVRSAYVSSVAGAVDHLLFITPRRIMLRLPAEQPITLFTRSLRTTDKFGATRVALATSEQAPEGTEIDFLLHLRTGAPARGKASPSRFTLDEIREALRYGQFLGIGQWRNGGFGRFAWQEIV